MGVFGAELPGHVHDPRWNLTSVDAAGLATAAIIGMLFGATTFGMLSDQYGRKPCFLACFALFSIATGCAALAPTTGAFAVLRFIGGFGIGGIIPIASALTTEFAPSGRSNREFTIMYSGYSFGILGPALAPYTMLTGAGWQHPRHGAHSRGCA